MNFTLNVDDQQAEIIRIALEGVMRKTSDLHQSLGVQIALQAGKVEPAPEEPKD